MAPRRGGGGGSISVGGSSSCERCLEPLHLSGSNWENAKIDAIFAFEMLALLVLVICLFIAFRFKWVRQAGKDKLRHAGYMIAVFWAIVFFALDATIIAMSENAVTTTRLFYLISIFSSLGWRLADLLILGIIQRTICESSTSPFARRLPPFHLTAVILLALLSTSSFVIYIYQIQDYITGSGWYLLAYNDVSEARNRLDLAYSVLYLVAVIEAGIVATIVFLQDRSKATLVMVSVVTPSLFLRSLLPVISSAISVAWINGHETSYEVSNNLMWANQFIYTITVAGVFLGVAIIGCWGPEGHALQGKYIGYDQPGVARV